MKLKFTSLKKLVWKNIENPVWETCGNERGWAQWNICLDLEFHVTSKLLFVEERIDSLFEIT